MKGRLSLDRFDLLLIYEALQGMEKVYEDYDHPPSDVEDLKDRIYKILRGAQIC